MGKQPSHPRTRWSDYISDLAWSHLGVDQENYLRLMKIVSWILCPGTAVPANLLGQKVVWKLTLWEPGYDIFVLRFWPKTSSCQLPYQHPSSSADCVRELFKDSNGSNSLLDCTRKNFLGGGCGIFASDVISSFWAILAHVAWPRALAQAKVFRWSFHWKLGSNLSLLSLWSTF